jgi:hypothetical protein
MSWKHCNQGEEKFSHRWQWFNIGRRSINISEFFISFKKLFSTIWKNSASRLEILLDQKSLMNISLVWQFWTELAGIYKDNRCWKESQVNSIWRKNFTPKSSLLKNCLFQCLVLILKNRIFNSLCLNTLHLDSSTISNTVSLNVYLYELK